MLLYSAPVLGLAVDVPIAQGWSSFRVGEQATFCWRLERIGAAEASLLVAYDAYADAEAWSPAGVRSSCVTLPAGPGQPLPDLSAIRAHIFLEFVDAGRKCAVMTCKHLTQRVA